MSLVLLFGCLSSVRAADDDRPATEAGSRASRPGVGLCQHVDCPEPGRGRGAADSSRGPAGDDEVTAPSSWSTGASRNGSSFAEVPRIPAYIRSSAMFFCVVIMVLGVVGNVMVPIVIARTKDMRNSTNIFLTNLSIADLLVLLVCTPTVLVELNTRPETWILGHGMCKAVPFVELTVAHASVLTILAISFERYYAICEPLKAGYVCTKARALLICTLAWAVAALFTSPIVLIATYRLEPYYDGTTVAVCFIAADSFWSAFYFIASITTFFLIPFAVLVLLYAAIAYKLLRRHSAFHQSAPSPSVANTIASIPPFVETVLRPPLRRVHNINSHQHQQQQQQHQQANHIRKHRKQVILMLAAVVASFFICLLPFRAFTLWVISSSAEDVAALGLEGYYNVLYFCRIMFYLNSALNPILYNLMSSKFRNGFWRLAVSCCGRQKHVRHHTHRTATTRCTATVQQSNEKPQRTLRREATFLVNSISTSSGTDRTYTRRSSSLSTSLESGRRDSHLVFSAITEIPNKPLSE